jgi:hypothetical protein
MSKLVHVGVSILSLAVFGACGSKSDDDGAGGSGGGIIIGNGGSISFPQGGNGSTSGKLDGGQLPLTPQQVTSIKGQACAGETIEGEALPSVIELVIDTSSSMNQKAPGGSQSKWEVTRAALLDAVVGGPSGGGLPATTGVGLIFYPNRMATINATPADVTSCVNTGAAIAPAVLGGATATQRSTLRTAIEQVQLAQSTPTNDAYKYAFENAISKVTLPGKRFMLLVTDGTPTLSLGCVNTTGSLSDVDPSPIVDAIRTAAAAGIKTFLIGSPGSEANRTWMSQAAVIGGTAPAGCQAAGPKWCHMDMTSSPNFSDALRAGLASVAGQVNSCEYGFAKAPSGQTISANNINVILTSGGSSQLVVRDDVGDCKQGWQLTADQHVLLCPDTCATVQNDPKMAVDVVFGCESIGTPPA